MIPNAVQRFAEAVQRDDDDIELDVAALLVGDWDDPDLDVAQHRRTLDQIAARAGRAVDTAGQLLGAGAAPRSTAARAVAATLFRDLGFRGNDADYYDPRNSFLGQVLQRRLGIPITLSVLYVEVARRVGLSASGVGFPGHFLVRVESGARPLVIDPYHAGAELDRPALESLLARFAGPEARLDRSTLAPAPKRKILSRMLHNLAGIYGRDGDLFRSLAVLERLAVLDAENPRIAGDLDRLRRQASALN